MPTFSGLTFSGAGTIVFIPFTSAGMTNFFFAVSSSSCWAKAEDRLVSTQEASRSEKRRFIMADQFYFHRFCTTTRLRQLTKIGDFG